MGVRLDYGRLAAEYPKRGALVCRHVLPLRGLLQEDYGKTLDCTLTSLACIWGEKYYSEIEAIADRYGYDGEKRGTSPLVIRRIMASFLRAHRLPGKARGLYGKGVGWNWLTAKRLAENGIPAVLNLWDDGRGYYHDHSVVLVGVEEYQRAKFLLVMDNWHRSLSLIDYSKLCVVSSLNWVEP